MIVKENRNDNDVSDKVVVQDCSPNSSNNSNMLIKKKIVKTFYVAVEDGRIKAMVVVCYLLSWNKETLNNSKSKTQEIVKREMETDNENMVVDII